MTVLMILFGPFIAVFTRLVCNMQAAHNDMHLQAATGRIPPGWGPDRERQYSFRHWVVDLRLWQAATDADVVRHGPMVAMRLTGVARDMVREMDPVILAQGRNIPDPNNPGYHVDQPGLDYLLEMLTARFAPLAQEVQMAAISDLFTFRKQSGDTYDEAISRFEIMVFRTQVHGNIALDPAIKTWLLLTALHVPKESWATLLAPFLGLLPQNVQQYQQFLDYLRRSGHLRDGTADQHIYRGNRQEGRGNQHFYTEEPTSQDSWNGVDSWSAPPEHAGYGTDQGAAASYFAGNDEIDESSGWSNPESDINLDDVLHLSFNDAGEALYLAYRGSKRRFRSYSRSGPRKGKGKGKRKGKNGNKKGKAKQMFWADGTPVPQAEDCAELFEVYYQGGKGKGKGGKGRKNPIGADGKVMLCSLCQSDEHFRAHCTASGKGKHAGKSSGYHADSSSWPNSTASLPSTTPLYLAAIFDEPTNLMTTSSTIIYSDGSREYMQPPPQSAIPTVQGIVPRFMTFVSHIIALAWWLPDLAFHAMVRLTGTREGLLVDCGAVGNLVGDRWVARSAALAQSAGRGTVIKGRPTQQVEGVGQGATVIKQCATVPICLANGIQGVYEASMVQDSDLPALLGLVTLESNMALIDCGNQRLIYPGKGGYEMKLSPGSVTMRLEKVASGHLLLPSSEWSKATGSTTLPDAKF